MVRREGGRREVVSSKERSSKEEVKRREGVRREVVRSKEFGGK